MLKWKDLGTASDRGVRPEIWRAVSFQSSEVERARQTWWNEGSGQRQDYAGKEYRETRGLECSLPTLTSQNWVEKDEPANKTKDACEV